MTSRRSGESRKRVRRRAARQRAAVLPQSAFELADALETPLRRTQDLVMALHYVGYGLSSLRDDSAPAINGLAEAMDIHIDRMRATLGLGREK